MCAIDCGSFGSLTSVRTLASAADVSFGSFAQRGIGEKPLQLGVGLAQLRQESDGLVGQLLRCDGVERRLDLRQRAVGALGNAGNVLRDPRRVEAGNAIRCGRQQLVQIRERRFDVESMQAIDDFRCRVDERRHRGRRARDVDVVGHPVDRQHGGRQRIDVVELEVVGAGDPLRREMHAQAALDFDLRRFRTRDVVRRASADEPRLELRLHHHVALALRHRLVLLVLDVREADARHLTDDHAAIFHLRADVESLHRLVEIRFHHGTRLQPAPGADDQQHGDTRGNRADDEQPELEIVRFLAHAATGSGLAVEELAHPRIVALVAQLARIAFGDDALLAAVEHDHAVGDREDARQLVRDDDERDAEVARESPDQRVELGGRDRIEARRRLVEEQDHRIERHRARDRRALLHAARDLRRQVAGERTEADERQLHPRDQLDLVGREVRVLLERQPHVLGERHRAEQRARLVHDADLAQDRAPRVAFGGDDVVAVDRYTVRSAAGRRPIMCFSSVLLPQPEPPRITNTSPRRTSKLTFSSSTTSP